MKRRQRRPVLELNQAQTGSHGEHPQNKSKQRASGPPGQNVPANPLANLLCQYNSDSDTEDSKKDVRKLDDQVNNFFKEIQLIAPKELVSNDSSNCAIPPNAIIKLARHANQREQMWRECLDESTGYPYYWHMETNEVTWEMPPELRCTKNNATTSTIAKLPTAQESHWVDFSSIAYQQSHENIPEGMIPREVVARNRNRYIRSETAENHDDSQLEQDIANASDVMEEDSDDGRIEMITSYGSDGSDSDTAENNQSNSKITSVSTSKSADVSSRLQSKNMKTLAATVASPRPPAALKRRNSDYERIIIRDDVKAQLPPNANMDDEILDSRKHSTDQVILPQRSIDRDTDENMSKTSIDNYNDVAKESASNSCDESVIKKDALCRHNVDSDLDFRISLVPGYDEDSDPEEETEAVVERKALFPIPQNEDASESAFLSHKSKQAVMLDQTRVSADSSNDSDTNASTTDKNHVVVQEGAEILEKTASTEDSCGKADDDTLKLNKFLDNMHGRNKCFQRKKRIAFDVTSGKAKATDDCETSKTENGTQNAEVNLCIDTDESQKEFNGEYQKDGNSVNEETIESTRSDFKEESSNIDEQTNTQCDSPENSKEDEEEVNQLTQIILEKLKFLSEGKQSVSPVQLMAIQLQTLFVAWEGGYLEKSYLRRWLIDTGHELERLEQDAAPPGWLCQWDRSHKRYYYQNATTGITQWTYPDTGIAGGTEEMEICSTPPPTEQEEIDEADKAYKAEPKPKKPKENDGEQNEKASEQRANDIEAPPPPQISNPSPPPPPRIFAEDLKKDKRKRDKCNEKSSGKKQRLEDAKVATMADTNQPENSSGFTHSSTPLSPQPSALPNMTNAEPLPPGVDLTDAPYEISATALKRIIYGAVPTQSNSLYDPSARDPAVPILGHPAAIVQEHYLQYPAYHPHLHASAALVLPHKHGVQPAIQIIPDYTPIYTNHKVIEKPPVKTAKESLVSALDSFYNDIARIENTAPEQIPLRQDVTPTEPAPLPVEEVKLEVEPEPVSTEMATREKKRKKTRIGISKKHKEVSSMVAKWQKAQQNFEDNT